MIEPHVLHGGASSWFRIAANSEVLRGVSSARLPPSLVPSFGAPVTPDSTRGDSVRLKPDSTDGALRTRFAESRAPDPESRVSTGSTRMFTPTRNCASADRNFVAIHRKM